jgi:hypothetical protein
MISKLITLYGWYDARSAATQFIVIFVATFIVTFPIAWWLQ